MWSWKCCWSPSLWNTTALFEWALCESGDSVILFQALSRRANFPCWKKNLIKSKGQQWTSLDYHGDNICFVCHMCHHYLLWFIISVSDFYLHFSQTQEVCRTLCCQHGVRAAATHCGSPGQQLWGDLQGRETPQSTNTPFILVPLTITTVFLFCSINCSICLQLQVVSLPAVELCYYTFKLRLCKETTVRLTWEILMCHSKRAGREKQIFRFLLKAEVRKRPKTKAGLPALHHFSFRLRSNLCLWNQLPKWLNATFDYNVSSTVKSTSSECRFQQHCLAPGAQPDLI